MKYDDDRLIDNAACASQLHALMDEETTRQAVKDNVCAPLRAEIAAEKQRADDLVVKLTALLGAIKDLRSCFKSTPALPTACREHSFLIAATGHRFDHCVERLDAAIDDASRGVL